MIWGYFVDPKCLIWGDTYASLYLWVEYCHRLNQQIFNALVGEVILEFVWLQQECLSTFQVF